MASSPAHSLTPLQRDLLAAFFEREQRFFLTGGGALVGFYFGHRTTDDLDFVSPPGVDLEEAGRALEDAALAVGAKLEKRTLYVHFRRYLARRGEEECVVDLVVDQAPMVEPNKARFGTANVDTLREIAANKICTLLSRSEIRDLVDLQALLASGIPLTGALADAEVKEAGAEPATLAWVLDELRIAPGATLPGGADPVALDAFRQDLVKQLRALAFEKARPRP